MLRLRSNREHALVLRVRSGPISAFLVWVSAFRVSALAFLLFDGEHPRNPRGHAMARPAVMPFKNVDGEPCFACGETENTRWYCAYDPGQIRRWLCRTPSRARYGASCARTPKSGQLVPAARIDGAECARVLCKCAECGDSDFGLTPKRPRRQPRLRRRRRWRKLLVLDTVVMRRCRVGLCVPRGGARHRARRCTLWFDAAGVSNAARDRRAR